MKITVYTITDCQFSKQEKEYLKQHNLPYEEKNLDTNKDFLTEMLAVSNNFAGTPVTKIEKDDGQISVLKGFTEDEFNQSLSLTQPKTVASTTAAEVKTAPVVTPTPPSPNPVPPPEPVVPPPPQPVEPPVVPTIPAEPPQPIPTVIEPPTTPAETTTSPVVPEATVVTLPPAPTPPTPSVADPQLNSILNDLQSMASNPGAANQGQSTTPPATVPNIPEPTFK